MRSPMDFSSNEAFDPTAIQAMDKAFKLACIALRERQQADEERLARLIVQAVKEGLPDPAELSERAVRNMTALI